MKSHAKVRKILASTPASIFTNRVPVISKGDLHASVQRHIDKNRHVLNMYQMSSADRSPAQKFASSSRKFLCRSSRIIFPIISKRQLFAITQHHMGKNMHIPNIFEMTSANRGPTQKVTSSLRQLPRQSSRIVVPVFEMSSAC